MAEHPTDDPNVATAAGAAPSLLEAVANTGLEGPPPMVGGPINPTEPFPSLDHDLMSAFLAFRQNYPQMMAQMRAAAAAPTVDGSSPPSAAPTQAATPKDASSSPAIAAEAAEAETFPPPPVVPKTTDAPAFPPVPPPILPKTLVSSRILPPPPPPPPVPGAAVAAASVPAENKAAMKPKEPAGPPPWHLMKAANQPAKASEPASSSRKNNDEQEVIDVDEEAKRLKLKRPSQAVLDEMMVNDQDAEPGSLDKKQKLMCKVVHPPTLATEAIWIVLELGPEAPDDYHQLAGIYGKVGTMNGKSIYKATHHSCEGAPKLTSFLWHDGKSDGFVWSYNVDNTVPVAWNMVEVIGWVSTDFSQTWIPWNAPQPVGYMKWFNMHTYWREKFSMLKEANLALTAEKNFLQEMMGKSHGKSQDGSGLPKVQKTGWMAKMVALTVAYQMHRWPLCDELINKWLDMMLTCFKFYIWMIMSMSCPCHVHVISWFYIHVHDIMG